MSLLQIFSFPFMRRALVAGTLVSLCCALLGVSLVLKRYSMIGDGLSHVSFGALAIAVALGFTPLYFSIPVVVLAAFFLLRMTWYLETGVWPPTGRALQPVLEEPLAGVLPVAIQDAAAEVLSAFFNWESPTFGDYSRRFDRLFALAGGLLSHYSPKDLEASTDAVSL